VTGSFVSADLRARVRGVAEPIARGLGRIGLTPNHLTLIGFGIAIVAGFAAASQAWLAAGLLVIFGGVFDLFDGALARATGQASRFGAFMDSVFDRWGEAAIYLGIAWGSLMALLPIAAVLAGSAMASAFMVSYARAKGESLGFRAGAGLANVGLAPREVRIVILTIGLLAAGLAGGVLVTECPPLPENSMMDCWGPIRAGGAQWLVLSLGLITILATITTIQRIVHVRNQAAREDQAPG
jgi:phosphatidylglycerophosphate synthase